MRSAPRMSSTEAFLHQLDNTARNLTGTIARPPGPLIARTPLNIVEFFQNQVRFVEWLKDRYGDMVFVGFGEQKFYIIGDPQWATEVLVSKNQSFIKDQATRDISQITGNGLLTSHGDHWKRQRKLAAPALKRKHIAHYATQMVETTKSHSKTYGHLDTHHVLEEMMSITLDIVVRTLFNVSIPSQQEAFKEAIDTLFEDFDRQKHSFWRFVPRPMQRHHIDAFERAKQAVDDLVYHVIKTRRQEEPGDDLLSMLIQAQDESGQGMTDEQLRDEVITMFIAGHETTALTLTYALYELGHRPQLQAQIHEELDAIIGSDAPNVTHVRQLPLLDALIKESLRLYPPAWAMGRQAIEDVQIGPWHVPEGSQVILSPWNMHRDERWFDRPLEFDPTRWLDGLEKQLPRHAYMPFGGGQRICIGNHFAKMEAILILATILQQYRIKGQQHEQLEYTSAITLRPKTDICLNFTERH